MSESPETSSKRSKESEYYVYDYYEEEDRLNEEFGTYLTDQSEYTFRRQLVDLKAPSEVKKNIAQIIQKYELNNGEEKAKYFRMLDILKYPFSRSHGQNVEDIRAHLRSAVQHLNKNIIGQSTAKEKLLDFISAALRGQAASSRRNFSINNRVIGFVGSPGLGKTMLAKEGLSRILGNRPVIKISCAGMMHCERLSGDLAIHVGGSYSIIIEEIIKCGVNNPIIIFDEVDKTVLNYGQDAVQNFLCRLLDPAWMTQFRDAFIGMEFDLSQCIFCLTYNNSNLISSILLDRIYEIPFHEYTVEEKVQILKLHLPKFLKELRLQKKIKFSSEAVLDLAHNSGTSIRRLLRDARQIIERVNTLEMLGDVYSKKYFLVKFPFTVQPKHSKIILESAAVTNLSYFI